VARRILLDCDPGNDDALAILVATAHPALELVAVTTGAGHLAAPRTARNAAIALACSGRRDIPLASGAHGPLVRPRLIAQVLDMTSALDPERPDLAAIPLDPRPAGELIAATLRAAPTTIITTGPLTNLALALHRDPDLVDAIERIVILGGTLGLGTKTAAAEWNMLCDPEAAAMVFAAGAPITLIPIDGAARAGITDGLIDAVAAHGSHAAALAAELLRSLVLTFRPGPLSPPVMPLNDPIAPLLAAQPALARTVPARVEIELAGRHTYGRTVIDIAGRSGLPDNADVVLDLDVAGVEQALIDVLGRAGR
jgi:inosine-uridine nucleoside N-ribohydrolase